MEVNCQVVGKIEKMAFGGNGILKKEGLVLFVPFSAPGDELSCEITDMKKNYGKAKILEILEKSPLRAKPECRYFGTCGGCQLQHLNYEAELEIKREWIEEALHRVGTFNDLTLPPVVPSPKEYGYRRHITLTLQAFAGYHSFDAKTLIKIEECPIFIEKENSLLKEIQILVEKLEIDETDAKLEVFKDESAYLFHFHFKRFPKNGEKVAKEFLENHPAIRGIILAARDKSREFGETRSTLSINGLEFSFSSSVFLQNNREQSFNIYHHLLEIIKQDNPKKVLDLYSGIGISSLLIAKEGVEVTGVEYSQASTKAARENAEANGIKKATFIKAAVEELIMKIDIPEFVILNPPREGVEREVMEALALKLPKKIVYISCMPATLARDLKLLKSHYRIVSCTPYDMFPKTTHVETVVVMERI